MSSFQWVELGKTDNTDLRLPELTAFAQRSGVELNIHRHETSSETLMADIQKEMTSAQIITVGTQFGGELIKQYPAVPQQLINMGFADSFILTNKRWWPRCAFYEALIHMFHEISDVDLSSYALVAGTHPSARACVAALSKVGYTRINITGNSKEEGLAMIADMKKTFFRVEMQFIEVSELVTLPGVHSMVISLCQPDVDQDVLTELCYFNFLVRGGIVIDTVFKPRITSLLESARDAGARVRFGYELTTLSDSTWVQWISERPLNIDDYRLRLAEMLD